MLYECHHGTDPGNRKTLRWFHDQFFDLDVWLDDTGRVESFLLSYDKPRNEHALSWIDGSGFMHARVDDGEGRPGRHKSSPVLLPNGKFPAEAVAARFRAEGAEIDHTIADFVHRTILAYPKG